MFDWFDWEDMGCLAVVGAILLILAIVFALFLFESWLVMLLWNAVIVATMGFGTLSFWAACGLTLLCHLLFGSLAKFSSNKK